ncbi:MAG: lasso peptide isopeptide bond-forming cyclase [Cyanobacteria bacterium P01_G01_bin.67]
MSAIIGIYYPNQQPVDRAKLVQMLDLLKHRGSDGANMWQENSIGLAHQMLWTTPESLGETLPATKGKLTITADARLDNREQLIPALDLTDYPAEEITDSDLLLAAYEKWGEHCPEHLLGDFAFAIWNGRNQTLFCARDYFGVKPFYYYHHPGKLFTFASEIKALFCLREVPRNLNEVRIGDYLEGILEDKTITFYQDILRLPPAHSLTLSSQGIRLREYWSLDPKYELKLNSAQEYAEAYLEVFTQAVRCRLRSAFPVGSALSGGLDSSSIVCVAREHLQQPLKTFSGIFKSVPESDEYSFINAVVEQGGIEPHYVNVDRISPLVDIEKVLWHQDEPIWTPNLFMHWGLYGSAQQQGVRIFLDGFLGDNVVCHGWEHLMDLAYDWRWLALYQEIKGIILRQPEYSQQDKIEMLKQYLWQFNLKPRTPKTLYKIWRRLRQSKSTNPQLSSKVNPDFTKQIELLQRSQQLQPSTPKPPQAAIKRRYRDLIAGEIPLGLEISNKTASAFAIESRFPFTDRRLAEFCLSIPGSQRIQDGLSRMIVRRALVNHLPEKVCWRTGKGNLSYNFHRSLMAFERERLDEIIMLNPQQIEKYINLNILRQQYQRYKTKASGGNTPLIWSATNLALWLNQTNVRGEN